MTPVTCHLRTCATGVAANGGTVESVRHCEACSLSCATATTSTSWTRNSTPCGAVSRGYRWRSSASWPPSGRTRRTRSPCQARRKPACARPRSATSCGWCRARCSSRGAGGSTTPRRSSPRRARRGALLQDVPVRALREGRHPRIRVRHLRRARCRALRRVDLLRHVVSGNHPHAGVDGRGSDSAPRR